MGLITDYLVAPSDDAAASIENSLLHDPVEAYGIDPAIMLGRLEVLLTGRTMDEVLDDLPEPVVVRNEGEQVTLRVSEHLTLALAAADGARLDAVAEPWSQAEELAGFEPADLATIARGLRRLARQARDDGGHVYCWLSV